MMTAASGTTYFRVEKRFGIPEATRLRDTLALLAPVKDVSIDFGAAQHIDDAALPVIAEMMTTLGGCRFRLIGLTRHRRRLLRYIGAPQDGSDATA